MTEKEVFTFEELDRATQEKVLDNYEVNLDYNWTYNVFDYFRACAYGVGFKDVKPFLARNTVSDFDGAIDLPLFLAHLRGVRGEDKFAALWPYVENGDILAGIEHSSVRGKHVPEAAWACLSAGTKNYDRVVKELEPLMEELEEELEAARVRLRDHLSDLVEAEYEQLTSYEAKVAEIEWNALKFTRDGKIIPD